MKKQIFTAVLVLAASALSAVAFADDTDLLGELDACLAAVEAPASASVAGQLAEHFQGTLELRGAYSFDAVPETFGTIDDDRWVGELRGEWASWTGGRAWDFHAAGWFNAGTRDQDYAGISRFMVDNDSERRYAELNEAWLNLSAGSLVFTLGKKVFHNGISTLYSPSDRYLSADLNDPVNPVYLGSWQLALDYSAGDTVYTAAILPFYQEKKIPAMGSRWMVSDMPSGSMEEIMGLYYYYRDQLMEDDRFAEIITSGGAVAVREDLPGNDPGEWGWFGRVKRPVGIWDTFVSVYHGPGFYPVIKIEDDGAQATIVKETPGVTQVSAGFSTIWKTTEFHGEACYSRSDHDYNDSYISYVGGFTHTDETLGGAVGVEKISLVLEYAGEMITDGQDAEAYIAGAKEARIGRNDLIASALVSITDDLSLGYLADFAIGDSAYFQRLGGNYRIMPGLVFTLDVEFFDGPLDTYFGRWRNNDRVVTTLRWSL